MKYPHLIGTLGTTSSFRVRFPARYLTSQEYSQESIYTNLRPLNYCQVINHHQPIVSSIEAQTSGGLLLAISLVS